MYTFISLSNEKITSAFIAFNRHIYIYIRASFLRSASAIVLLRTPQNCPRSTFHSTPHDQQFAWLIAEMLENKILLIGSYKAFIIGDERSLYGTITLANKC